MTNRVYIHDAATISAQGWLPNLGIETAVKPLENFSAAEPAYTELLPPNLARRMAKITRMALYCALHIANKKSPTAIDGIIAATGLGNLADTEKFIHTYLKSTGGLIPPTSFTQSSHNTLAGQLALILKNHNYNVTYVQQSFSFESALLDAQLQLQSGMQNVLVGAGDEKISLLETIGKGLGVADEILIQLGEGASFFWLSNQPSDVEVIDVVLQYEIEDTASAVDAFLHLHGLQPSDIFTVCSTALGARSSLGNVDANLLFGRYFTNSAQALHLAASEIAHSRTQNALVVNTDHLRNIALTLLRAT